MGVRWKCTLICYSVYSKMLDGIVNSMILPIGKLATSLLLTHSIDKLRFLLTCIDVAFLGRLYKD